MFAIVTILTAAPLPSRAEWLGARAALAVRRSGRLAAVAGATLLLFLLSLFGISSSVPHGAVWMPPFPAGVAALILALFAGFASNLALEIARPAIATAREAEQSAGAPLVCMIRVPEGDAIPDRMDPFQMLYLGLTATGKRPRTVAIAGDNRTVVATTAGKLALVAATDTTATLVVDVDAEGSAIAGYYGLPPEPGFTDAVAGVRLWREVARPVGASSGLAIDVVPAGSIRQDVTDPELLRPARSDFAGFREQYDLCIMAAPTRIAVDQLGALIESPMVVVCAVLGQTTAETLRAATNRLRTSGASVVGIVLWDGDLPVVQSRNMLMAKILGVR